MIALCRLHDKLSAIWAQAIQNKKGFALLMIVVFVLV